MCRSNRPNGFWATAGVLYDFDPLKGWRAWLPESPHAPGYGRTKPQALADLKSLRARAKATEGRRQAPPPTSPTADGRPR